jgi:recombination protein RecT
MAESIQNKMAAKKSGANSMQALIKSMEGEIKRALPSVLTPERFTRIVLTAISSNPTLKACEPKSFLGAMMQAAQLGLEINTNLGQAYVIPYKNHGVLQAQFQLGYKGLIDLAYRSGEVELVQAQVVYENDEFECEYGLEPKLRHVPASGDRGKPVKVYAMFKTKSGGYGYEVSSVEEIMEHGRKYSKAFSSGPWQTAPIEMCKKTMLKRVLKYAPLKSEFVRQMSADETIKSNIDPVMYDVSDETDYEAKETEYEVVNKDGEVLDMVEEDDAE